MPRQTPADIVIDPSSPAPLYQQIAEAIRAQIERGELSPGDALAPLREAADAWGVNLHTVRHAYTALARDGLVETHRGARGTRVAPQAKRFAFVQAAALNEEIDRLIADARVQGVAPGELLQRVRERLQVDSAERAVAYVVECSEWQRAAHVRELQGLFDLDARVWPLDEGEPPEDGVIVATYFHYNDIRRLWPQRLRDVHFITIAPQADVMAECAALGAAALIVAERDEPTAQIVAADVSALPGAERWEIQARVSTDPDDIVRHLAKGEIALLPPRMWASLSESERKSGRAVEVVYEFDPKELASLGGALRWSPAK